MRSTHEVVWRKSIEPNRVQRFSSASDGRNGAFRFPFADVTLNVICSDGADWDHVSVSLPDRCPKWSEMSHVKSLFFGEEEAVMQLHSPESDYVNNHPYCLHLWRPQSATIPLPPSILVGYRDKGVLLSAGGVR